jgi:isoleucyl-tRNA synthetase
VKKIKPDFKTLGPKYGKMMKQIAAAIGSMNQKDISKIETDGKFEIKAGDQQISVSLEDVEIISEDIPGWLVASEGSLTLALDITVSEELRFEGIARELVNRIQNIRKESEYNVTDKINIVIEKHEAINDAISKFGDYICAQTLAENISVSNDMKNNMMKKIELDDEIIVHIKVTKVSN